MKKNSHYRTLPSRQLFSTLLLRFTSNIFWGLRITLPNVYLQMFQSHRKGFILILCNCGLFIWRSQEDKLSLDCRFPTCKQQAMVTSNASCYRQGNRCSEPPHFMAAGRRTGHLEESLLRSFLRHKSPMNIIKSVRVAR